MVLVLTIHHPLQDHPAYTSVFSGWPYFPGMDTINSDLPTVMSSISKPLQMASSAGGSKRRDDLDDGSQSDVRLSPLCFL